MRQYMIDELSFLERDNLDSYLKRTLKPGGLDGAFFLELPRDLWSDAQQGHEKCAPFYFSVVLDREAIRFEFLVRSSNNLHCSCITWATPAQRQFVIDFADRMLAEELISA